jgi:hypothetical protein
MRKIVFALAAAAAIGIAVPAVVTTPAEAHTVTIEKRVHRDHGRHYGHRHYGWHRDWQHRHHQHRHNHRHRHHHNHHHGWR